MARLPNFLVIIRSEKLSGKGQGRGCLGVRKKERFVLGKRTFRSQKSKHFVLRIIQVRELGEVDRYSWENGNAVHYAYLPQKEITYEYNSQLRPENFPFRVVNSFQPVGFDVISPLNLLYGKMNQNLPTRAYWYNVSDATDICAEYTFRYTLTGDYITGMTIEEKINPVNGATAENNTYEYEFIYNFVVEQK